MGHVLAINALALAGMIVALWLVSLRIRDVSFIDAFWAFGMVVLAWTTWLQRDAPTTTHALLLLGLTSIWGLRLATHLFFRWRRDGEDPRYRRIIGNLVEKRGWSFARASLLQVFLLQAPLLYIVCLPAQLGQLGDPVTQPGWLTWAGATLAITGIAFESTGDAQLRAFRADPVNKGTVLATGLWRYTRHPNYFGDACTWWGLGLIAAETVPGRFGLIGPVLITVLLTKWSGVPLLERGLGKTRPGYADYVRRTSAFFPWPPKP